MIAGGAAVALLWNQQRITNDVDIVSEGMTPQLRKAVARVARDYDRTRLVQRCRKAEGSSQRGRAAHSCVRGNTTAGVCRAGQLRPHNEVGVGPGHR